MGPARYQEMSKSEGDLGTPLLPSSPAAWQQAMDFAQFLLLLDEAAPLFGLVDGGPTIDTRRCREVLRTGRSRGYRETPFDQLGEKLTGLWAELELFATLRDR